MEREYKLLVPKYDNDGHKISTDELKKHALELTEHFEGITIIPKTLGCFVGTEGLECEENSAFILSRDSKDSSVHRRDKEFVEEVAEKMGKSLGQESILTVENIVKDVEFVEGIRKKTVPKKIREKDLFKHLI